MKLLDTRLAAFFEIARLNSFTKAAEALHITQPALSHRIRKLETDLQVSLFVRSSGGITLTEAGTKLLQYCRSQTQIEDEFLRSLVDSNTTALKGALRIGSVSSLSWSVVTPSISPLIRRNPDVHLDIVSKEVSELPSLLRRGRIDFMVTIEKLNDASVEMHSLGFEKYVLIESTKKNRREKVFLDHDEKDQFTAEFFRLQKWSQKDMVRSYMDDNHGLLAGVSEGLGKAVVPFHLLKNQSSIRIVDHLKPLEKEVFLCYFKQPFYTRLHKAVTKAIIDGTNSVLI